MCGCILYCVFCLVCALRVLYVGLLFWFGVVCCVDVCVCVLVWCYVMCGLCWCVVLWLMCVLRGVRCVLLLFVGLI